MSLHNRNGNTIEYRQFQKPQNLLGEVEFDYYFTAKKAWRSSTEIFLSLWTIIVDEQGYAYGLLTRHHGHFEPWKEVISNRICQHLAHLGYDNLIIRRITRDLIVEKEGHLISSKAECVGDRIGIDGSNNLYIRKDRFSLIK
ncbi:MAG: hypothetical protein ABGW91_06245 [Christiangramia sp.]|nr:hypothetical protein [Christiangramia sp.]|tara:strand:+ start:253 stop:678 length:426 start_codon:yes stop_codon:yes gene_type:complete